MMMVMVTNTDQGALDPQSGKAIRTVMTTTMTEEQARQSGSDAGAKPYRKTRALRRTLLDEDACPMCFGDFADDRKAEPRTARGGPRAAPEQIEDVQPVFGRHARTAVAHTYSAIRSNLDDYLGFAWRMGKRILNQVAQRIGDRRRIAGDHYRPLVVGQRDALAGGECQVSHRPNHLRRDRAQISGLRDIQRERIQPGHA